MTDVTALDTGRRMMDKKLHYYAFTFIGDRSQYYYSCYMGFDYKKVSVANIQDAKVEAGAGKESVLLSLSYMGNMTKEEVRGEE